MYIYTRAHTPHTHTYIHPVPHIYVAYMYTTLNKPHDIIFIVIVIIIIIIMSVSIMSQDTSNSILTLHSANRVNF